jgi:hypothetical protein
MPGDWTPEPFEADDGTIPLERFVDVLSDFKFVALDTAIDRVLSVRGIDLVRTEWLKAFGEGLHEFRVRHDADEVARMFGGEAPEVDGQPEKVLLRVFVHFHGQKVVLLLGGYDKGADPKERRQQRDRRGPPAVRPVQGTATPRASEEGARPWLTSYGELPILVRRRSPHGPQLPGRHGRSPRAPVARRQGAPRGL